MDSQNYLSKLSDGLAIGGIQDTIRALNERHIDRLLVCATLETSPGWQCLECAALYLGIDAKPERCSYCGSRKVHMADVKSQMIAQAYHHGCCIEIMSRCPELEQYGGVGALLTEKASGGGLQRAA